MNTVSVADHEKLNYQEHRRGHHLVVTILHRPWPVQDLR